MAVAFAPAYLLADAARNALPSESDLSGVSYRAVLSAFVFSAAALGWALAAGRSMRLRHAAKGFAIGGVVGAATSLLGYWLNDFIYDNRPVLVIRFAAMGVLIGRAGVVAPGGWGAAASAAAGGPLAGAILVS